MTATSTQSVSEREQLIAALERSAKAYLDCIGSVPESAAGLKVNADSWSIGEIAEHVAVAEHGMFRAYEMAAEKTTPPDYERDQKIVSGAPDRTVKREAPERARPKGRWKTIAASIEAFEQARQRSIEFLRRAEDLRSTAVQHPLLGEMDGHQIFLVMAGHTERHTAQIEEIKQSAAYLEKTRIRDQVSK